MRKTIIINPVGSRCNLRCDYCFNLPHMEDFDVNIMPDEILEQVIKTSLRASNDIIYLFHGGEPLLAGIPFFRKLLEYQKRYVNGHKIQNHIQTNATLINSKWTYFLKKNNFKISTSLDGPQFLHDLHRTDMDGNGTFSRVMDSIALLKKNGVPFGIVVTLNKDNVGYPEELYNFLIGENKIELFEMNPCSPIKEDFSQIPDEMDLANFLITFFDLWWKDDNPNISIRLFENLLRVLVHGDPTDCSFRSKACHQFLAVDVSGDLYPCARFVNEDETYLGNVMDGGIDGVLKRKETKSIYEKMSMISKCQGCKWLKACGGGCAYQRWLLGGWDSKYYLCDVRKKVFSHIEKRYYNFS